MKIFPSFKQKLAAYSAKIIPVGFVMLFFLVGLFFTFANVVAEIGVLSAKGEPAAWIIFVSMLYACAGPGMAIVISSLLGWFFSSIFMRRTVKEAYPADLLKRDFALADDDMVMGFTRLHQITVYRTKKRLPDSIANDISATLEPLFPLWHYFPLLPSKFIGARKICFEREEIEVIKKRTLDNLLAAMPEVLQSVVAEKDSLISSLQMGHERASITMLYLR